jgi:amidase
MQRISLEPGKHAYSMSKYYTPIATVEPGETFMVETQDGPDGTIKSESDKPSEKLNFLHANPETGPIFIKGAEPGDTLVVEIKDIQPLIEYAVTFTVKGFGGLVGNSYTRLLNPPLEERVKLVRIKNGVVYWNDKIFFPYKPFYGCIGTAPVQQAIDCMSPGNHGGNMDCPHCGVGNNVYLPVRVPGAYLFLGDVMATQGQGELCGTCGEHPAVGTVRVDLIKGKSIEWPRVESDTHIMCIGSAKPMEDAARIAYYELVQWMASEFGFDPIEAYMVLSHIGECNIANMVDTLYSMVARCPKKYLVAK